MKIALIVGTRPNFVKAAPLLRAIVEHNESGNDPAIESTLIHTGQHYDSMMFDSIFADLEIPAPDCNLDVAGGAHSEQVGRTMIALEPVLKEQAPDWVVVFGDVNATMAAALTAKKLLLRVAHVEAGLRSWDWSMPEEINRVVTDRICDLLCATGETSLWNLKCEGAEEERLFLAGNIMIDSLERQLPKARTFDPADIAAHYLSIGEAPALLPSRGFAFCTLHRPATVDSAAILGPVIDCLEGLCDRMPILVALHPRTAARMEEFRLFERCPRLTFLHPLPYSALLAMLDTAAVVLTDSGGMQEECCVLGRPCLTLRWNTERPETLVENGGTCELVGNDPMYIHDGFHRALLHLEGRPHRPELWDGATAGRILEQLINLSGQPPHLTGGV